jgi:hypothetical protein
MPNITLANMVPVEIKPGWVIRQYLDIAHQLSPSKDADLGEVLYAVGTDRELVRALLDFDALVVQKNKQYKDAWQIDGPVTALTDLKDKLYRLESASESQAILSWDKDKLRGTFFDVFIRSLMCMAWFGLNSFKDDDDDRQLAGG